MSKPPSRQAMRWHNLLKQSKKRINGSVTYERKQFNRAFRRWSRKITDDLELPLDDDN
jgi:hypothetical protein